MNSNVETIKRLSSYRRVLYKLKSLGFEKVFSDNLADSLGVSSAQVRKDFSVFELTGNKKGGYIINQLLERLSQILGKDQVYKVVVLGCGNMGKAIMNYYGFAGEGMRIVAGFDASPLMIDHDASIPIFDINDLSSYVSKEKIKIAIMTVPESTASRVLEQLLKIGIKGILNFTPIQFRSAENAVIRNINIVHELENMVYFINDLENGENL